LCSPSGAVEAEELIAHSDLAADLHAQVQTALAILSYLPVEPCRDYLVDLTIRRLRGLAAHAEGPRSGVIRVDPRQWFRNTAAVTAVAASVVVFAGIFIPSPPSIRRRQYAQGSEQPMENLLQSISLYSSDYTQFYNTSWRQVPSSSLGVPEPIEYYPPGVYPFIRLGPETLPASLEENLGRQPADNLFQPWLPVVSDQRR